MRRPSLSFPRALVSVAIVVAATVALHADWPQFRGPDGSGHAQGNVPLTWDDTRNIKWQTAIHDQGWSSPVILGNQVWVTTATPDGRRLSAVAVDTATGKVLHDVLVFRVDQPQPKHPFNTYASPTPVIEPGRVYVTYGSAGTAAIDTKTGKVLWTRQDLHINHVRGPGSSPIIFRQLLYLHFDGSDRQFVVALDKDTGKTVWKTDRTVDYRDLGPDGRPQFEGDWRKAYSTPHVATFGGRQVLISLGSMAVYAYDLLNGKELWRVEEPENFSASTRPLVARGMIFFSSGQPPGQVLAIRPDPDGRATQKDIVWRLHRAVPARASLLLVDDLIFMVNDTGIASCVAADTGEVVWTARVQGEYSASPIWAAGRIYFFNETGKTTVIEPGRGFKVLAENQLGDGFMASAAVDGNAFILRSRSHLYRIEQP